MKQAPLAPGPQPQFLAENTEFVQHIKKMQMLGQAVYFEEPAPAYEPVIATRSELDDSARTTDTALVVAARGWRRLQMLYTAKAQYQTVGLKSVFPLETAIIFRNTPPLPTIRPEVPSGWTQWELGLEQLDAQSLQVFMRQVERTPRITGFNRYSNLLGINNGPKTFNLLRDFAELKLARSPQ